MNQLSWVAAIGMVGLVLFSNSASSQDTSKPIGVLLAAGDIAKCDVKNGKLIDAGKAMLTAEIIKREIDEAKKSNLPVRVLALGDLAYDSGTSNDFKCFDASWGPLVDQMLPVPGNHEHEKPNPLATPYYNYFINKHGLKFIPSNKGYYALSFPDPKDGPWRLIGLNGHLPDGGGVAEQRTFLEAELKADSSPCVLAFWHPPVFSSGLHGHGDSKNLGEELCRRDDKRKACRGIDLMAKEFRMLYDKGATAVLAGHDHNFEQFGRMDPTGIADTKGTRSFVVGTGGAGLYRRQYTKRWSNEGFSDQTRGVLKLTLHSDRYSWTFLPVKGDKAITMTVTSDKCNSRR